MAPLNNNTSLSALSIPGSHDSAALHEPLVGTAACQSLTIDQQLHAGVRFLDIRCRHVRNAFAIYHGAVDQHLLFTEVLATCLHFLDAHPAESILLSLKEEYDASENTRTFAETFDACAAANPTRWYLAPALPRLADVRGKLVVFRRFTAPAPRGIDASHWPANRTFTSDTPAARLRVQDQYVLDDPAAKWTAIRNLLDEAQTGDTKTLFVNFTSGYQKSLLGIPAIPPVSNFIHPQLDGYFSAHPAGRSGIIVMDFVDPQTCRAIIRTNP